MRSSHKLHLTFTVFRKPRLGKLKRMAIDEIAIGKGHRYLTVVWNLETGAVVFVGEGKGAEALEPFWKLAPTVHRAHAARHRGENADSAPHRSSKRPRLG